MLVALTTVLALVALLALAGLVHARSALRVERMRHPGRPAAPPAVPSPPPAVGEAAAPAEAPPAPGPPGARASVPADVVEGLWALELLRAARTWRVVAPDGALPAPVSPEPAAELATGVALELDRLREEAGLPGDLRPAEIGGEVGVAAAFVTLRLVQEALAVLAPASEAVDVELDVGAGAAATLSAVPLGAPEVDLSVLAAVAARMGANVRCTRESSRTVVRLDVPDLRVPPGGPPG